MSASAVTISSSKIIPNTNIPTFTLTSEKLGDGFQVYVSSVINNGQDVVVRPIGIRNIESIKCSHAIIERKCLAEITRGQGGKGLNFAVYEQVLPDSTSQVKMNIHVEFKGEKTFAGEVEVLQVYKNEDFDRLQGVYEAFCASAIKSLMEFQTKKK